MSIKNIKNEFYQVLDSISNDGISQYDEVALLTELKKQSIAQKEIENIMHDAAHYGYMKIVISYINSMSPTEDFISELLCTTIYSEENSLEDFLTLLENVDVQYLHPSHCDDAIHEEIIMAIFARNDFYPYIEALYKKNNNCFTSKDFQTALDVLLGGEIEDDEEDNLEKYLHLTHNSFFENSTNEQRKIFWDSLLNKFKICSYQCDFEFLKKEEYSLFSQYINSKGISFKDLAIISELSFFIETYDIDAYDNLDNKDVFECYSEEVIISFIDKTNFITEHFIYGAAAYGYTKLIDKLKDIISVDMLNSMLFYALSDDYGNKVRLKTASYLLKTFGINNFDITSDIFYYIKKNNLSNVLLVLLKNKNNVSSIDWKMWFKDTDEFSDIIETYCYDVIFSVMPYEYRTSLMELMEERKSYVKLKLNDKCTKFKEFADDYGYDF